MNTSGFHSISNKQALSFNGQVNQSMKEICSPLKHLGTNFFIYKRLFKDGRFLYVCQDFAWANQCFKLSLMGGRTFQEELNKFEANKNPHFVWTGRPSKKDDLYPALYDFDIWNGVSLYRQAGDSVEVFGFGGKRKQDNLPSFYVNNLDLLYRFSHYFKDKASDIIDPSDSSKLFEIESSGPKKEQDIDQKIKTFISETETNRYQLLTKTGAPVFLSKREVECIFYLSRGKTLKEAAYFMGVSHRTVESYLTTVKSKTGSISKSQAIELFLEQSFGWL